MDKNKLIQELRIEHPHRKYIDCMSCDNSFSTDDNKLICSFKDKKVEESHLCNNFS